MQGKRGKTFDRKLNKIEKRRKTSKEKIFKPIHVFITVCLQKSSEIRCY